MYIFSDQLWPVVVFRFAGLQSLAEHEQSLLLWDQCFQRGGRFIVLRIFQDESALVHPEGAGLVTRAWLKSGAGQHIRDIVIAMINIVPDKAYDRMKHMSVEAAFGVPGGIFRTPEDALTWLHHLLGPDTDIDLGHVQHQLEQSMQAKISPVF